MDAITAVVELIKALAWPLVTFAVFLLFRRPLQSLIPGIKSLKFAGAEVTMANQVDEVKALAKVIPPPAAEAPPATPEALTEVDRLYEIASLVPRAAISEAWRKVELAGAEAVRRNCPPDLPKSLRSPGTFAEALRRYDVITPELFVALTKLRKIRNEAVHAADFDIEPTTARDYVETALTLFRDLEGASRAHEILRSLKTWGKTSAE